MVLDLTLYKGAGILVPSRGPFRYVREKLEVVVDIVEDVVHCDAFMHYPDYLFGLEKEVDVSDDEPDELIRHKSDYVLPEPHIPGEGCID